MTDWVLQEATIDELSRAMGAGRLTSEQDEPRFTGFSVTCEGI